MSGTVGQLLTEIKAIQDVAKALGEAAIINGPVLGAPAIKMHLTRLRSLVEDLDERLSS